MRLPSMGQSRPVYLSNAEIIAIQLLGLLSCSSSEPLHGAIPLLHSELSRRNEGLTCFYRIQPT